QQSPSFFVVDVELALTHGRPSQVCRIKECLLLCAAVGLHVGSVGQNYGLSIADGSPTFWGLDRRPRILERIVNSALVGPDRVAASTGAVVFSAFHDDPAVGQHGRAEIKWRVAARERGDLCPSAVDVAAVAVGRELVPRTVVGGGAGETVGLRVHYDGPIRQQQHYARVKCRLIGERFPSLASSKGGRDHETQQEGS